MRAGSATHPKPHELLLLLGLTGGLDGPKNRFQKIILWQRAIEKLLGVDHGLWNCLNAIEGNKVGEFGGFNTIGRNLVAGHGKLVSQAYRLRAVWSRGCDKHLKVNRLGQGGKLLLAFRPQIWFAF